MAEGVIHIGRKGTKKFAFGEDGPEFSVDVVTVFQEWVNIDEGLRNDGAVKAEDMPAYHAAAVEFATRLSSSDAGTITTAEALDFIARLREQYDELSSFFVPRKREEPASHASSETGVLFTEEPDSAPSTN